MMSTSPSSAASGVRGFPVPCSFIYGKIDVIIEQNDSTVFASLERLNDISVFPY